MFLTLSLARFVTCQFCSQSEVNIDYKGFDIASRKRKSAVVGAAHRTSKEEAIKWFQTKVTFLSIIYI